MLQLKVITPKKVVLEKEVISVTLPTKEGEITILEKHENLFALLTEGIIKIKNKDNDEDFLSVGGGYVETDGREVIILVSRAYGQDEIDEEMIQKALEEAKKLLSQAKDKAKKEEAIAMMRRAVIDSKLLKKRKAKIV